MTRKRYVSTNISVDPRVRDLAQESEFAALLYTWMIPHADDAGCITADYDSLLMQIMPGFRWRTAADIEAAVELMVRLGLIERTDDHLCFPQSFYKYQAYISADRRATEPEPAPTGGRRKSAQNRASSETAPKPAQKSTSFKSSSSLIKSPNGDVTFPEVDEGDEATTEPAAEAIDQVYAEYKAKIQPLSRLCPRKKIAARLRRFTTAELLEGIENFAEDPWWMANNANRGAAWFFDSDDRAEKFLLMRAPPPKPLALVAANGYQVPSNNRAAPMPPDHTGVRRMPRG